MTLFLISNFPILMWKREQGEFIKANSRWHKVELNPVEAENWALLHALSWIKFQNISNEMDAQLVVDGINKDQTGMSEFHFLLKKCKHVLSSIPNSEVSFVRGQTNHVALIIARASRL